MNRCPYCSREIPDSSLFCPYCGKPQAPPDKASDKSEPKLTSAPIYETPEYGRPDYSSGEQPASYNPAENSFPWDEKPDRSAPEAELAEKELEADAAIERKTFTEGFPKVGEPWRSESGDNSDVTVDWSGSPAEAGSGGVRGEVEDVTEAGSRQDPLKRAEEIRSARHKQEDRIGCFTKLICFAIPLIGLLIIIGISPNYQNARKEASAFTIMGIIAWFVYLIYYIGI